ncbi:MAG: sugB [Verrucomicrobiaceae bacterium]|nr:sugB [Verrucomicrobiaceae bacterium]
MNVRKSLTSTFSLLVLGALMWPIVYAMWMSFTPGEMLLPPRGVWSLRWYETFFARAEWTDSLWHSLTVGALATGTSLLCGTTAAVAVTRHSFPGRRLLQSAVMLPLFIPALVLAMALLPVMRAIGLWGSLVSVALAHSLWGLPLVFQAVKGALEDMDPHLELAARGLGASGAQTFWLVTLPTILPAMTVGGLLAFIVSFNELVMALFLCTPAIETLPKVIWPNLRYTLSPLVAAASGIAVLVTVLLLAAIGWLARQHRKENLVR